MDDSRVTYPETADPTEAGTSHDNATDEYIRVPCINALTAAGAPGTDNGDEGALVALLALNVCATTLNV